MIMLGEKKIDIVSKGPVFTKSDGERNDRPVFISGDPDKLKQAFFNILKNAIDYSYAKEKIEFTAFKYLRFIQIEIKNYGPGIPEEEKPYVFERFYRAANAATSYKEGSGLGLAITKEIILKHKDEIKIENSYGNWTKVIVILPIKNV